MKANKIKKTNNFKLKEMLTVPMYLKINQFKIITK